MIISRTPLRISFAGGGSDLPAYYKQEPGAVTSTAINKYIYITVNKKFDQKIRASYSVTEIVDSVGQLKHELIRAALRLVGLDGGIEITSISDIPSQGTGLGSSSTYTVGLLKALYAFIGKHVGAERLAREACRIEIDICKRSSGKQDQYIAAYGGLQHIQFNPDETVFVDPLICSSETRRALQSGLLLLYTGLTRSAVDILAEQARNTENDAEGTRCHENGTRRCRAPTWRPLERARIRAGWRKESWPAASATPRSTNGTNGRASTVQSEARSPAQGAAASCCCMPPRSATQRSCTSCLS